MKGTNCSIAIGLGSSSDLSAHMRLAVPAEDSCATIGCMVSFRFSTNIFQLHWCMKRRQPPAISSSPSGERSTMLSMELSEAPKYSSKPVAAHRPYAGQALARCALVRPGVLVARLQRNPQRRAVGLEGPGVVWAAKELAGVAARPVPEPRPLVGAAVHQHAHAAVGMAHHDQRLARDLVADPVARFRQLAFVANVVPGVGEEMLLLQLEQF